MSKRAERDVKELLEKLLKIYGKEGGIAFNQLSKGPIRTAEEVQPDPERQDKAEQAQET